MIQLEKGIVNTSFLSTEHLHTMFLIYLTIPYYLSNYAFTLNLSGSISPMSDKSDTS